MVIKLLINDQDFSKFALKTAEVGLEPLDTIELIITKSLNERNLKSVIIKQENRADDAYKLFIDFENKMKKHNIHQSSIAHCLQTTQASISRALKSKKNNTMLFNKIIESKDKLLIDAYTYQHGYELKHKDFIDENHSIYCEAKAEKIISSSVSKKLSSE